MQKYNFLKIPQSLCFWPKVNLQNCKIEIGVGNWSPADDIYVKTIKKLKLLEIDSFSSSKFFGIVWEFKLFCWIWCRTQKSQHCLPFARRRKRRCSEWREFLKRTFFGGARMKGISSMRLGEDWIGWDWRDRRRFLFEEKLMTSWFETPESSSGDDFGGERWQPKHALVW